MSKVQDLCFDAEWYLSNYKDVAAASVDPLTHYLKSGRFEGRKPCCKTAAPQMISWEALRQAAAQGQWDEAKQRLDTTDATAFCASLRHPDATLLVLEILTVARAFETAGQILNDATSDFGALPALSLAKGNLIQAQTGQNKDWLQAIAPAFPKKTGLTVNAAIDAPKLPVFDRLGTAPRRKARQLMPLDLVSVIVPVLNAAKTLPTALNSLTLQTWPNLEILVVDNGSNDGSQQVAAQFANQDPRISVLDGSSDPGAYPARNLGLAAAKGALITVQDADDWAHPDKINMHVKALIKHPKAQASLSDWARATPDLWFTNTRYDVSLIHPNISSLMIRHPLRDTLGYWDRVRADADTEYLRRIIHTFGEAAVVRVAQGQVMSIGRHHEQSLTQASDTALADEADSPRQIYQNNAAAWHLSSAKPYLEQYPKTRPFPAPDALTRGIKPQ